MTKRILLAMSLTLVAFVFVSNLQAQVTIGTQADPKATLDVVKIPGYNSAEGIIAPRFTGDELRNKNGQYGADQRGTIVYVTAAVSDNTVQKPDPTALVNAEGYYYFDGQYWLKFGGEGPDPFVLEDVLKGVKAIEPVVAMQIAPDTVNVKLIDASDTAINDGDVLAFNSSTNKWEPKTLHTLEYIWLPAVNLPWNTNGVVEEIDLFKIYQQSFAPETYMGGMPKSGGLIESTSYGGASGNYVSSTNGFRSMMRGSDTPQSFDYVVTYFDKSIVKITELGTNGKMKYQPVTGVIPPSNAFVNVLLIRK